MSAARKLRRIIEKKIAKVKGPKAMNRRYITLLPDIEVMTLDGDKPYYLDQDGRSEPLSHRHYIKSRTLDAAFVTKGFAGSCQAGTIRTLVDPLSPGDVLVLDQDDWDVLKTAIEKPRVQMQDGRVLDTGFDGVAGPQIVPFGRAILDAKVEDPRKAGKPKKSEGPEAPRALLDAKVEDPPEAPESEPEPEPD